MWDHGSHLPLRPQGQGERAGGSLEVLENGRGGERKCQGARLMTDKILKTGSFYVAVLSLLFTTCCCALYKTILTAFCRFAFPSPNMSPNQNIHIRFASYLYKYAKLCSAFCINHMVNLKAVKWAAGNNSNETICQQLEVVNIFLADVKRFKQ